MSTAALPSYSGVSFRPAWEPRCVARFQIYGNIPSWVLSLRARVIVEEEALRLEKMKCGKWRVADGADLLYSCPPTKTRHRACRYIWICLSFMIEVSQITSPLFSPA